jgi:hypothetical protein
MYVRAISSSLRDGTHVYVLPTEVVVTTPRVRDAHGERVGAVDRPPDMSCRLFA